MIGDVFIRSGPDYGPWRNGGPYGAAIHCLQCPGGVDVRSLAGPGSYTANAGVSPHTMSDQKRIVQILGEDRSGAHVGSRGNPILVGFEMTGFAEWTPAQWWDNSATLLNAARAVGTLWRVRGWNVDDLRWGSLAELADARARYDRGAPPAAPRMWPHWDVTKILGGTNHWDVGLGFLFAEFERWAREWAAGRGTPGSGSRPDPGGNPGGGGGAESDWFANATVLDVALACAGR